MCYNRVNEFPANGLDKSVADPATWGPHAERVTHKRTEH